jgi:hypothetical protein
MIEKDSVEIDAVKTIYQGDRGNPAYAFPWVETSRLEQTFLELAEQWRQETGMLLVML